MIHQEAWYREASQEKELASLLRDFGRGDEEALMRFLILQSRNPSGEGWNKCRKNLAEPLTKAIRGYFTVTMDLEKVLRLDREVRVPLRNYYHVRREVPPKEIEDALERDTESSVNVSFNMDTFFHHVLQLCDKTYIGGAPDLDEVFGLWEILKDAVKGWKEALEDLQRVSEGILKTGSSSLEEEFNRTVKDYQVSGDNSDLMRVVQLSMRSGTGLRGIRSDVRVRARGLLLERAREEMQEALSEDFSYRMEEAFPAPFGKVGPNLYVEFSGESKRGPIIIRVYPLMDSTLDRRETVLTLSNIQNGQALGIDFTDHFTVGELIEILSSKGRKR